MGNTPAKTDESENTGKTTENQGEKKFTQEDLDRVISTRLIQEKKKYEGIDLDDLKAKAAELAAIKDKEKAKDKPKELTTEEILNQAEARARAALKAEIDARDLKDLRSELLQNEGKDLLTGFRGLVSGKNADEIKESIKAALETQKAELEARGLQHATQKKTFGRPGNPDPNQNKKPTFTRAQIADMSPEEYSKNRVAIADAKREGRLTN